MAAVMKLAVCTFLLAVVLNGATAAAYSNINVPYRFLCPPCSSPCRNAVCPRYGGAVCRVLPCSCRVRWYLGNRDVTSWCFSPRPYHIPGPVINPEPLARTVVQYFPAPDRAEVESAHHHIDLPLPQACYRPNLCLRHCTDTCHYTACPRFPSAECRVMRCTCQAKWYFRGSDVTAQCFTHTSSGPHHVPGPAIKPAPVVHYFPVPEVEPREPVSSPNVTVSSSREPIRSPAPTPADSSLPVEVESG